MKKRTNERTNERTNKWAANAMWRDATRSDARRRHFGLSSPRGYRSSERALLTYSRYRTISTLVSASILFTTTTTTTTTRRSHRDARTVRLPHASQGKKERDFSIIYICDERDEKYEKLKSSIYVAKCRICGIRHKIYTYNSLLLQ